jgi:hypothetical protein
MFAAVLARMHSQSRRLDCGERATSDRNGTVTRMSAGGALGLLTALAIAMPLLTSHAADTPPQSDDADSVITPANVPNLQLVFSFRTDSPRAHTAPPQVDANTLFVLTPYPHTIYALDLTQLEPSITWRYMPPANGVDAGLQCCGAASGGMTLAGGYLLLAMLVT